MSKRTKVTIAYLIAVVGCVFGIFCAVFMLPSIACYLDAAITILAALYVLLASRCPYCGKYRIIINPFSHKRFRCKSCGKEQP